MRYALLVLVLVGGLFFSSLAKAAEPLFGFMDGKYYDSSQTLKYLCFLDNNCYDLQGKLAFQREPIISSPTNPTPVVINPETPAIPIPTPVVNTPVPTANSSPKIPSIFPVVEIDPAYSAPEILTRTSPQAKTKLFAIRAKPPITTLISGWNNVKYSIDSQDFAYSDVSVLCGAEGGTSFVVNVDTNGNISTDKNCFGYLGFALKNAHAGKITITVTGVTLFNIDTGENYGQATGLPISKSIIITE